MRLEQMSDENARKLLQKPWTTKAELDEVVSTLESTDKQQLIALELVDKDLRLYMSNMQNAWFGQSISPSNLDGVIIDSAKKHGLDSSYLKYTTHRLLVELG